MFKYLAEILSQFTTKQKMRALIILVATIIIISLGTIYLKGLNVPTEELQSQIVAQKEMIGMQQSDINQLQKQVRELNSVIVHNEMECTDSTLALQQYYSAKLIEQQRYVTQTIEHIKSILIAGKKPNQRVYEMAIIDSTYDAQPKVMMSAPQSSDSEVYIDGAINELNKIQKKLKK